MERGIAPHGRKGGTAMQPLKGVRVLDLTTINPFTDTEFSDYGAEVIKVERPGSGDSIRDYPPFRDGVSVYHCYTDRGKKSITLNLRSDEGREILKELVKDADILVENFKAGTMEKMGLGYEELARLNPALVYGKLSSYGGVGPQKDYIAYDIAIQAQTGIMDATGYPDGEPSRVGCYVSDHLSCTYLGTAIIMALYHAKKTGRGQRVEVSMFEAVLSVMGEKVAALNCGQNASRTGHLHDAYAPYDILPCRDGYAALAVTSDSQWQAFCAAFGKDEWAADPGFAENAARRAHYLEDLRGRLVTLFADMTRREITERCRGAGVPAGPVNTMEEAIASPQTAARRMMPLVHDQRIGDVVTVGRVIRFGEEFTSAPLLGQNTAEIVGQALIRRGVAPDAVEQRLAALAEQGVI